MRFEQDPAKRAKWRPIAQLHEDHGPVVLLDIDDPGGVSTGSCMDVSFDRNNWTHFAELPLLTSEMADQMKRERDHQKRLDELGITDKDIAETRFPRWPEYR